VRALKRLFWLRNVAVVAIAIAALVCAVPASALAADGHGGAVGHGGFGGHTGSGIHGGGHPGFGGHPGHPGHIGHPGRPGFIGHPHGFVRGPHGFVAVAPGFGWWPTYPYYVPSYVPAPSGYWYYCASAGSYYPYVASCPEAWVPVPAS